MAVILQVPEDLQSVHSLAEWLSDAAVAGSSIAGSSSSPVPTESPDNPPLPDYGIGTQCVLTLMMVFMLILSVCGNGVVCYLVYHNPAMRSSINLLLASMAFSNTLLGILCMPFDQLTLLVGNWVLGPISCQLNDFCFDLFSQVGVTVLVLISVDRYMILVQRHDKLSYRTAKIAVGVIWILSALVYLPVLIGWPGFQSFTGQTHGELVFAETVAQKFYICLQFVLGLALPLATMLFCYLSILCRVKQSSAQVHVQQLPSSGPAAGTKRHSLASMARSRLFMVDMRFKTRTFATVLIVFVSFCVFQVPYGVCILVWNFQRRYPTPAYPYLLWWYYLNATFNPLIYAWRIRKFRAACLELFPVLATCFRPLDKQPPLRAEPSTIYQLSEPSYFTPSNSHSSF